MKKIYVRIASSFISFEQAELNLEEIGNDNFDIVKQKSKKRWNRELGRIKIEGSTTDQGPYIFIPVCTGPCFSRESFMKQMPPAKIVHYSPFNGKSITGLYVYG
ncbi:MAG: glycoside hydrolase domain-containing protein [Bacteroidota bacterium]